MANKLLIISLCTVFLLGFNALARASGWAVIVGIDRYQSSAISELSGAANDARALASTVSDVFGMPQNQVLVYTSDSDSSYLPSTGNVVKALNYIARQARPNELFVLAFSGHGVASGRENYLLTYYSEMGALADTALRLSRVKELIEAIPSTRKLVILDACRNDPNRGKGDEANPLLEDFARGIAVKTKSGSQAEVAATLFSCSLGERAFEWPDKGRGFFSWYLEQGLKGEAADSAGNVTLNSLIRYLQGAVPDGVQRVLGVDRQQKPYVVMEGADPGSWLLARSSTPGWEDTIRKRQEQLERLEKRAQEQEAYERQLQQIDSEAAKEESVQKKKLEELDARIRSMQERLGTRDTRAGDSLDALLAMVREREAEEQRLEDLQRQREEARKQREAERQRKEQEIQKLEVQRKLNDWNAFQDDVEKYKQIISSPHSKGLEQTAWNQLTAKYWTDSSPIASGDLAALEQAVFKRILGEHIVDRVAGVEFRFAYIPPGSFMMGSPLGEPGRDDDETQHRVTLTKGFYMQTTEVTQGQWKAVMGNNPSHFSNCGVQCPVENVSWNDCQEFIQKLNQVAGSNRYRLPTEAEWEYAARAGTTTPFAFGSCLSTDQANYDGNYPLSGYPKGQNRERTVPVASFSPNAWGLYDMHGNVWEWCQDWYGAYPLGAVTDPTGPSSGSSRVLRGGSWFHSARSCRSADRLSGSPDNRGSALGLRLVMLMFDTQTSESPFPADDPGNKRLALEAVEGSFLETEHSGRLFVIHGSVRNQYPFPVRHIRLHAYLHVEAPDSSLDTLLFAGNPLSEKELTSLPLQQIQDTMRTKAGRDGMNERIPPGSTVPFSVVFAELPANPIEYAVKIQSSEPIGQLPLHQFGRTHSKQEILPKPQAKPTLPRTAWYIQIGAYSQEAAARYIQRRIERAGYPVRVMEIGPAGKRLHATRVGPYSSESEARRAAETIKQQGHLPYVLSIQE